LTLKYLDYQAKYVSNIKITDIQEIALAFRTLADVAILSVEETP
jgi:hypothetical protein